MLVDVNQQSLDEAVVVLVSETGAYYFSKEDWTRWRWLLPPATDAVEVEGVLYFPVQLIPGVTLAFDAKALTLHISVPAAAFEASARRQDDKAWVATSRAAPGGFFNYDTYFSRFQGVNQRSGQFEWGYFNAQGVGTTTLLAYQLGVRPSVKRLDSVWTVDKPEALQTWRWGDIVNRPGYWGRAVRLGGVQYSSNFALQPSMQTFPSQTASGVAVLPSTVDVFVNNALTTRQTVPPGPFAISNLPLVTGAGEVSVVVRDLLGREQRVTRPFYASQVLLKPGLESYSTEFGFLRENFGINSFDYSSGLATGTYRRGLTDQLTGELHAEVMARQLTIGGGADYLLQKFATLSTYVAQSQSSKGKGALAALALEHRGASWSFGARAQRTTPSFAQVGLQADELPPALIRSANVSYISQNAGAVALAYIDQINRTSASARLASASYSKSLGQWASLNVSLLRDLGGGRSTTLFALLSVPLESASSLTFTSQVTRDQQGSQSREASASFQRNLPPGEGYGYRLLSRTGGSSEGSFSAQGDAGLLTAGIAQSQGETATRLGLSGGAAWMGGKVYTSRRIDQSFAVVHVLDFPGVRVYADNHLAGNTDAHGSALIPRLRAYERNAITLEQSDIPLDTTIDTLKLQVTPRFRSGVEVTFPVTRTAGATLNIHTEDAQDLPVGATVTVNDAGRPHIVGYGGEVYVTGLTKSTHLKARWGAQQCEFDLAFESDGAILPHLGTFICKAVKP